MRGESLRTVDWPWSAGLYNDRFSNAPPLDAPEDDECGAPGLSQTFAVLLVALASASVAWLHSPAGPGDSGAYRHAAADQDQAASEDDQASGGWRSERYEHSEPRLSGGVVRT